MKRTTNNKSLKKALLSMLFVMAFSVGAQAQIFLMAEDDNRDEIDPSSIAIDVPIHFVEYDQYTPLGSGLLVLTSLGLGYALAKKRKQEK